MLILDVVLRYLLIIWYYKILKIWKKYHCGVFLKKCNSKKFQIKLVLMTVGWLTILLLFLGGENRIDEIIMILPEYSKQCININTERNCASIDLIRREKEDLLIYFRFVSVFIICYIIHIFANNFFFIFRIFIKKYISHFTEFVI